MGRSRREGKERERGARKRGKMTKINLGEGLIYGSSLYYLCNFSIGLKCFKRKKECTELLVGSIPSHSDYRNSTQIRFF